MFSIREPAAAAAKVCAAGGKGSQKCIAAATAILLLLWVSEVTLGIFRVQFWGFSVLQRHGVFLPAGDFFHGDLSGNQQQQQAGACAAAGGKGSQNAWQQQELTTATTTTTSTTTTTTTTATSTSTSTRTSTTIPIWRPAAAVAAALSLADDFFRACFLSRNWSFVITLHAIPFGGTRGHWIVCVCFGFAQILWCSGRRFHK